MRQLIGFVLLACSLLGWTVAQGAVTTIKKTVITNGKRFDITGVRVELNDPAVTLKLGLAYDHVGRTETLGSIAKRAGAVAAINGSFFDAYTQDPLKNPDMSLITGGELIFKSGIGSLLGFEADNTPHIASARYTLTGTVERNGHSDTWFTYYMNRKPTATPCVTLFNRYWGPDVNSLYGTSVVVENGKVTKITGENVPTPEHGFVLNVRGECGLLTRFAVGETVAFTPELTMLDDDSASATAVWGRVREAVGAGPRVLIAGKPVYDPVREGFSDPKILALSGARSAAGYTADHVLYLITTRGAQVSDLGGILKSFGCVEGMNLDGGASSGLWYRGNYLVTPGRLIGNALLVLEKK